MISRICTIKGKTVHPVIFLVRKIKCTHSCSSRSLFWKDEQNCVIDNLKQNLLHLIPKQESYTPWSSIESHLLLKIIPKENICEVISCNWANYDNKDLNTGSQRKYNRTEGRTMKRNYRLLPHEKKIHKATSYSSDDNCTLFKSLPKLIISVNVPLVFTVRCYYCSWVSYLVTGIWQLRIKKKVAQCICVPNAWIVLNFTYILCVFVLY